MSIKMGKLKIKPVFTTSGRYWGKFRIIMLGTDFSAIKYSFVYDDHVVKILIKFVDRKLKFYFLVSYLYKKKYHYYKHGKDKFLPVFCKKQSA
jgi:hypothetical protein